MRKDYVRGTSDVENTITYTGRRFDPETGLMYYRARYYHPTLGRFIGRDPIEYAAQDANLYRYLSNNPTGGTDPSGFREVTIAVRPQPFPGPENDPNPDQGDVQIYKQIGRLGAKFGWTVITGIHAGQANQKIRDSLNEGDCIKKLIIGAHGGLVEGNMGGVHGIRIGGKNNPTGKPFRVGITYNYYRDPIWDPGEFPQVRFSTTEGFDQFFAGLCGKFCKGAEIELHGCNTMSGPLGLAFAKELELITGATVHGFAEETEVGTENDDFITKPANDPQPGLWDPPGSPSPTKPHEFDALDDVWNYWPLNYFK